MEREAEVDVDEERSARSLSLGEAEGLAGLQVGGVEIVECGQVSLGHTVAAEWAGSGGEAVRSACLDLVGREEGVQSGR